MANKAAVKILRQYKKGRPLSIAQQNYSKHELADALDDSRTVGECARFLARIHELRQDLLGSLKLGSSEQQMSLIAQARDAALKLAAELDDILPYLLHAADFDSPKSR